MEELVQSDLVLRLASEEAAHYWPMERELLAVIAEQLSALVYITAKVHGGKNLPDPLQVPRPGRYDEAATRVTSETQQKPKNVVSFSEFARMHAPPPQEG